MSMPSTPGAPGAPRYDGPEPTQAPYPEEGYRGPEGYADPGMTQTYQQPRSYAPPRDPRYREQNQSNFADEAARFIRTPETKEFYRTSEFLLTVVGLLILVIAAASQDNFDAPQMWRYFTAVLVAYILSRGIAKAGSNRANPQSMPR